MIYTCTFRKLDGYSQVDDSLNKEHQLVHNGVLLLPHQDGLFLLTQGGPQPELKIEISTNRTRQYFPYSVCVEGEGKTIEVIEVIVQCIT